MAGKRTGNHCEAKSEKGPERRLQAINEGACKTVVLAEEGRSAGSAISPKPASGPLFIQRKSFAIFMRLTLRTLSWPDSSTAVSWLDSASK